MRSTYAAAFIITFMANWNNFLWPLIVLQTPDMKTINLVLSSLSSAYIPDFGVVMIGTVGGDIANSRGVLCNAETICPGNGRVSEMMNLCERFDKQWHFIPVNLRHSPRRRWRQLNRLICLIPR